MTPADLLTFVRRSKLTVVSTTSAAGAPQAAVVGIAVTDALEIVFDTLETSRKAVNLRRDARIALVSAGTARPSSARGSPTSPRGPSWNESRRCTSPPFPTASRASPGRGSRFRVRLGWARYSDFRNPDALIVELGEAAL